MLRKKEPSAAAHDAQIAIATACPGATVTWSASIVVMPAVLHPLRHIAVHVMQAKGIGRKTAHRSRSIIVPAAAATIAIGPIGAYTVAPTVSSPRARARGVFPFRFTGHIGLELTDINKESRSNKEYCDVVSDMMFR